MNEKTTPATPVQTGTSHDDKAKTATMTPPASPTVAPTAPHVAPATAPKV